MTRVDGTARREAIASQPSKRARLSSQTFPIASNNYFKIATFQTAEPRARDGQLAVVLRDREEGSHGRGCVQYLRGGLVRPLGLGRLAASARSGRHAQLSHRRDAAKASRRASDEPRRARRSRRVQARGAHRAGRRQGIVRRGRGPEGRVPPPDPAEGAHARDPVRDRIERMRRRRRRRSGARRPPLGPLFRDLPVPATGSHLARARSPRAAPVARRRARRTPSQARSHPR